MKFKNLIQEWGRYSFIFYFTLSVIKDLDLNAYKIFKKKIKTGKFFCKSQLRKKVYQIKNFILRFVDWTKYADSSGYQWHEFAKKQFDNNLLNEIQLSWNSEIGIEKMTLKKIYYWICPLINWS